MNVLNIGNTHSTLGIWDGGGFTAVTTCPTADLTPEFLPRGETVAASVVPEVAVRLADVKICFIDALHCRKTIDFGGIDAPRLGADRVANAFALVHFFRLPAVVVDCGTAVTFEIVDEKMRFYSGGIAPGRRLMRNALHCGTAQLPGIPLTERAPESFGADTVGNLKFGIDRGSIGMVREMLDYTRRSVPVGEIVFTGGDADFFLAEITDARPAPENFTLYGILLAAGVL